MDQQTGSALGIAGCVSGVLAAIYTYYKHSACHAKCCGRDMDIKMDLSPVEPNKEEIKISIPSIEP